MQQNPVNIRYNQSKSDSNIVKSIGIQGAQDELTKTGNYAYGNTVNARVDIDNVPRFGQPELRRDPDN